MNKIGVNLIREMRSDEIGNLIERIEVRRLKIEMIDREVERIKRKEEKREEGWLSIEVEIEEKRLEKGLIGEIWKG